MLPLSATMVVHPEHKPDKHKEDEQHSKEHVDHVAVDVVHGPHIVVNGRIGTFKVEVTQILIATSIEQLQRQREKENGREKEREGEKRREGERG